MRLKLKMALLAGFFLFAPDAGAALQVFACESDWAALVRELGGADVEVESATTAQQDVHHIQPRPSLIARWRRADLVVCTGAELEAGWLPALAEKGNNPKVNPGAPGYFEASRFVAMLDVPASVDRSQGDVHALGNPHVQTGPQNIAPIAEALAQRLAQVDPAHADGYRARHADFARRWSAALAKWQAQAAPLKGVRVVSHHRSWVYLYAWLGIEEVATLEPKPGVPPSAAQLESVLARVAAQPVAMVVRAPYEDVRASEWLAGRTGIPAVLLPLSAGGVPGSDDLFGVFDATLARLLAALPAKPPAPALPASGAPPAQPAPRAQSP